MRAQLGDIGVVQQLRVHSNCAYCMMHTLLALLLFVVVFVVPNQEATTETSGKLRSD
ncbi:hypothetical protein J6590_052259 [Homalodisca vitripennis]|nr:hypothetical protein J6590_052259 [Homalodisca vitripennis]